MTVGEGALLGVGNYTQSANASRIILTDGTLEGGPFSIDSGVLVGSGTILGDVTNSGQIDPGGTVSPTLPLAIVGNYTQEPNGVLNFDLGGTTPGSGYNQLMVSARHRSTARSTSPRVGDSCLPPATRSRS